MSAVTFCLFRSEKNTQTRVEIIQISFLQSHISYCRAIQNSKCIHLL